MAQCGCTIQCTFYKQIILSPSAWLNDSIISAAQTLMLQHFPLMSGLQPPILQHAWGFDVHRGDFVQILHVHNNHWSVVSNIGCEDGVVKYYDSMYPSVSSKTMQLIASLVFTPASELVVRIMDVGQQSNGCLLYTSPSPRDATLSRMPSSA